MRKIFLIEILIFFALTETVAQNLLGISLEDNQTSTQIPFKNESNLIIVPLQINGKGPYNFILDSGSESSMIFDKWLIDSTYFDTGLTVPIYDNEGEVITDLLVARGLSISLPGLIGNNQSMLVFQEYNLDIRNALGVEAVGILGSELFNRFVVEVDYKHLLVTLHEPEQFNRPKRFKQVPIEIRGSRPFLNVTIDQKNARSTNATLLIDTGASSALFLDAQNNDDIVVPDKNINHTVGNGITGTIKGKVGRIKRIKINKYTFKKVVTSFPENWINQNKVILGQEQGSRYGTIGSETLSRLHVYYDYLNKQLFIKPSGTYRKKFEFNTIGFRIVSLGESFDEVYISEIIAGSPAEKMGFNVGDQILVINNKPVSAYSFSEINGVLRAKPRTKSVLIIKRNGELLEKVVKHKKLI